MKGSTLRRGAAWLMACAVLTCATPSWAQSWTNERVTDVMTDRTEDFAMVRFGQQPFQAMFYAACRSEDIEVWFAPRDYIGLSELNGPYVGADDARIYINYRVNDEPVQKGRLARLSPDEDAFLFEDKADIVRALLGKRLIVQWRDSRGSSTTVSIPTLGSTAAIKKLPCAQPYIATCGDGILQPGEECDDGPLNSDGWGVACNSDCTAAPQVCGDGAVQEDEACDSALPMPEGAEDTCTPECRLQSIFAQLLVPCAGVPARIFVGGTEVGACDALLERIPVGEQEVIRRAPGFADATERVVFTAGGLVELTAAPAPLLLTVNLAGATVSIDGQTVGVSSGQQDRFEVASGFRRVVVMKPGFATYVADLAMNAGTARAEEVTLRAATGSVVGRKSAGCPDGFARIEAGRMRLGSPADEAGRGQDERRRNVTIPASFCLLRTEVTYRFWRELLGPDSIAASPCGEDCPVTSVSWHQAAAFADAMSRREGLTPCYAAPRAVPASCSGYRLPSETEWEYAARAEEEDARYGDIDEIAWYRGTAGDSIHRVATKTSNDFGLFDMLGNAAEWTESEYMLSLGGAPVPFSEIREFVVRGGSFADGKYLIRAASRKAHPPAFSAPSLGFRLARDAR